MKFKINLFSDQKL